MRHVQSENREIGAMLQDIERKVKKIENDLDNVDLLVEEDIAVMFTRYSLSLPPAEQSAFVEAFKSKHMNELRSRKLGSLNRTRDKLLTLRFQLEHQRVGSSAKTSTLAENAA
jgi:hypothetical protein